MCDFFFLYLPKFYFYFKKNKQKFSCFNNNLAVLAVFPYKYYMELSTKKNGIVQRMTVNFCDGFSYE